MEIWGSDQAIHMAQSAATLVRLQELLAEELVLILLCVVFMGVSAKALTEAPQGCLHLQESVLRILGDLRLIMKIFEFLATAVMLSCIITCVYSFKTKPSLAGRLGVITIILSALLFAVRVIAFAFTKNGVERTVLICAGLVSALAIAFYWLRVWQVKRPDRMMLNKSGAEPDGVD